MKRFAILLALCLSLLALTGCSAQETALEDLTKALTEKGFTVSVTEDLPHDEVFPALNAYRIDQLDIGEEMVCVYFFKSGEDLVKGMAEWRKFAETAPFSAPPSLYHTDTLLLLYPGTDESLIAAFDELWQPM